MKRKTLSLEEARARRDRKLREVRRRQNTGIVLAVIAGIALFAGAIYLYNSKLWDIREIEVVGNRRVSTSTVVKVLDVPKKQSLLKFDSVSPARRLAKEPWIKKVSFSRRLPSTLIVKIDERRPVFAITRGKSHFLIDESGFVIAASESVSRGVIQLDDLRTVRLRTGLRLSSASFRNAVQTTAEIDAATRKKVAWVAAPSVAGLSLWTDDQVEIVMGRARNTKYKLSVVKKILESSDVKVIYIDVTTPKTPVVKKVEAAPR